MLCWEPARKFLFWLWESNIFNSGTWSLISMHNIVYVYETCKEVTLRGSVMARDWKATLKSVWGFRHEHGQPEQFTTMWSSSPTSAKASTAGYIDNYNYNCSLQSAKQIPISILPLGSCSGELTRMPTRSRGGGEPPGEGGGVCCTTSHGW